MNTLRHNPPKLSTVKLIHCYAVITFLITFLFAQQGDAVESGPSLYVQLDQPLIVNIFTRDSVHFLQTTIQFKLTDPNLAQAVQSHITPLKHNLIILLSGKKLYELKTVAGKTKLREDALKLVRKVMKENTGEPSIERVFFTSLILQ